MIDKTYTNIFTESTIQNLEFNKNIGNFYITHLFFSATNTPGLLCSLNQCRASAHFTPVNYKSSTLGRSAAFNDSEFLPFPNW